MRTFAPIKLVQLLPNLGLLVLFFLPFFSFLSIAIKDPDQAHAPLLVAVLAYLFATKKEAFYKAEVSPRAIWGYFSFFTGLILYLFGSIVNVTFIELGAIIPTVCGLVLLFRGWQALKAIAFPLFFLMFLLPFPDSLISAITSPMKLAVSWASELVLYQLGYPVARSGVIFNIGQYKLFVADACAGMHTLLSLEALGLLYLNLVKHSSAFRNIFLAILIIPLSFIANVIRVITIALVTYYWGDEIGSGFVHGALGMILFIVALILIIATDTALQKAATFFETRNSHV